jgi:hypothetical protein
MNPKHEACSTMKRNWRQLVFLGSLWRTPVRRYGANTGVNPWNGFC